MKKIAAYIVTTVHAIGHVFARPERSVVMLISTDVNQYAM